MIGEYDATAEEERSLHAVISHDSSANLQLQQRFSSAEKPIIDFDQKEISSSSSINSKQKETLNEQEQIDLEFRELKKLVKYPYLPPLAEMQRWPQRAQTVEQVYTLVLDLDETLIHFEVEEDQASEEPGYYLIRPGALRFLNELSEYFEIVVFTAAMPDYADWILDNIDRKNSITHRLYRQHTTPHEDYAIKDLNCLGRDLSKTIIIDNLAENFRFTTPENGIWVESWFDDMEDKVLTLLNPLLKQIQERLLDVRIVLSEKNKEEVLYRCLEEGVSIDIE